MDKLAITETRTLTDERGDKWTFTVTIDYSDLSYEQIAQKAFSHDWIGIQSSLRKLSTAELEAFGGVIERKATPKGTRGVRVMTEAEVLAYLRQHPELIDKL